MDVANAAPGVCGSARRAPAIAPSALAPATPGPSHATALASGRLVSLLAGRGWWGPFLGGGGGTRGATGGGMDAIFFGLKRAHQSTVRFGHAELRRYRLTPARFDLLFACTQHPGRMLQSTLRRILGVARSTISRMLGALERLGFLERDERRYSRCVQLTPLGRRSIRRAARRMIGRRQARRAVDGAFGRRPSLRFVQRGDLEGLLRLVRRRFGDVATLDYPWYVDH